MRYLAITGYADTPVSANEPRDGIFDVRSGTVVDFIGPVTPTDERFPDYIKQYPGEDLVVLAADFDKGKQAIPPTDFFGLVDRPVDAQYRFLVASLHEDWGVYDRTTGYFAPGVGENHLDDVRAIAVAANRKPTTLVGFTWVDPDDYLEEISE